MPAAGRDRGWVAVRIDPDVWREEVERLDPGSAGRVAAERERPRLAQPRTARRALDRGQPPSAERSG